MGKWEGGVGAGNLEFVGPCEMARADRRVPFGAQKLAFRTYCLFLMGLFEFTLAMFYGCFVSVNILSGTDTWIRNPILRIQEASLGQIRTVRRNFRKFEKYVRYRYLVNHKILQSTGSPCQLITDSQKPNT